MSKEWGVADLHAHSLFSDGTDEPAEVVRRAKAAGLDALALTDHDVIDGLPEAQAAAGEIGLELIPGIEISCMDGERQEVHLLAYWIDARDAALRSTLHQQQESRRRRLDAIILRLAEHGVTVTREEILAIADRGSVGRPHIARALLARGAVQSVEEAFQRFLADDAPCYVKSSELSSAEAIRLVRQAGGVPVVAHPAFLRDDTAIERLYAQGLAGVEAYHGRHSPSVAERYAARAQSLGLLVTGGSDYHGANKKKEGATLGSVKLPYQHVEALRAWKHAHTSAI